jgi:two-component system, NtrC family, sensor kinase
VAILIWNDDYSVGIEEVDQQHRGLVDMINRLDLAIAEGASTAVVGKLLGDLKSYTHYHFSTEEHLMREGGCDSAHLRLHLRQHRDFERSLEQFARAYDVSGSVVAGSLLEFLIKWLMSHIMGSDKEMGRLLRGETPTCGGALSESDRERWLRRQLDQEVAQRNMLNALREAESRFRVIADTVPVLIWMGDSGGGRSFFNKTWLDFTGRSADDESGWGWLADVHPEDRAAYLEAFRQALGGRHEYSAEFRLRRADGEYRWMVENGVPRSTRGGTFTGFIGSTTDITARKHAEMVLQHARKCLEHEVAERTAELRRANEEQRRLIGRLKTTHNQLLQSEKLAAIGELATGVAHEINNPMGFVGANLRRLGEYLGDMLRLVEAYWDMHGGADAVSPMAPPAKWETMIDLPYLREDVGVLLRETAAGVERVQRIVHDLLEFAEGEADEWQWTDLHRALDGAITVANRELAGRADVRKDYGDLPDVWCLPRQLGQVFLNLITNAAQAIGASGTITLSTRREGEGVRVEIADTGCGIAPEHLKKVFDPFFTTRPAGQGSGLGLSIAYGVVNRHRGRIDVESKVGTGTTFSIWLPVRQAGSSELPAAA